MMKLSAFFGALVALAIVSAATDQLTGWRDAGPDWARIIHHIVAMTSGAVLWSICQKFWNR